MLDLKPFNKIPFPLTVRASVLRQDSRLYFDFNWTDPTGLLLDGVNERLQADWTRADGLWQTTCFEAFVGEPGKAGYWEFNFSPSRHQWNVYFFDDYRRPQPPTPSQDFELLRIETNRSALKVEVAKRGAELKALEGNLCAVIRTKWGLSYFAPAHAAIKADFHARASFSLKF